MSLLRNLMLNTFIVACIFPSGIKKHVGTARGNNRTGTFQSSVKYMRLMKEANPDIPIFTNLIVEEMIRFSILKQ